jgi:ABC-2 type transport system permease protein
VNGICTIYRRELAGLFFAPLAWVLLCAALLFNGAFLSVFVAAFQGDVGQSLSFLVGGSWTFWMLLVLLPPLLTMRMFSEEARTGLLEFLLTAPVTDVAIVLGKLAAAATVMALVWTSVLVYGLMFQGLGTAPDWPPVLSSVLGATLLSTIFCAVGLAVSASTNTPLLAAFLAVLANALLLSLSYLDLLLPLPGGHWLKVALGHANLVTQFSASFGVGVLDTRQIVVDLLWTGFFVFLATRILEARRWW